MIPSIILLCRIVYNELCYTIHTNDTPVVTAYRLKYNRVTIVTFYHASRWTISNSINQIYKIYKIEIM